MAVEALRQVLDSTMLNIQYQGVRFQDTSFKLAMVIPDTDDGLEVQLRLQPVTKSSKEIEPIWHGFVVESSADGRWQIRSEGNHLPILHPERTPLSMSHRHFTTR